MGIVAPISSAYPEDGAVFFEKGYAGSTIDEADSDNSDLFGERHYKRGKFSDSYKKLKEYQNSLKERAERPAPSNKPPNLKVEDSSALATQNKEESGIKEFTIDGERRDGSGTGENSASSSLGAQPVDLKKVGKVEVSAYVSGEPQSHLYEQLRNVAELKKIRGVTVREVIVIGKPFSNEELAREIIKINPKETPVRFLLKLPETESFTYSPVWVVTSPKGGKWIYEGRFSPSELFSK